MESKTKQSVIRIMLSILLIQILLFAISLTVIYIRFPKTLVGVTKRTSDLVGYELGKITSYDMIAANAATEEDGEEYYELRQVMTDIMMSDSDIQRLQIIWIDQNQTVKCLYDTDVTEGKCAIGEDHDVLAWLEMNVNDFRNGNIPEAVPVKVNGLRMVRAFSVFCEGAEGNGYLVTDIWADGFITDILSNFASIIIWFIIMTVILIFLSILMCYLGVTKPMNKLADAVADYMSDGYSGRCLKNIEDVDVRGCYETVNLKQSILKMGTDIDEYITQIREKTFESEHDAMTMLNNKAKFFIRMNEEYSALKSVFVVYLDINNLKVINDLYGHAVGDSLIMKVAEKLRQLKGDNIHTYRFGGDEFLIIMGNWEESEAKVFINSWYSRIGSLNRSSDAVKCTLAYGVAYAEGDFILDNVIRNADEAMYKTKLMQKREQRASEDSDTETKATWETDEVSEKQKRKTLEETESSNLKAEGSKVGASD